ncbi:helix-turn-helix domain-containing protein [Kineococcus indalonis]|uniref:helix-turn-helix domain-containing protein n=1 Tax=Kineococcus indalonis TaxID=2696566 RepID=UPI00141237F5|nr:helix-turn-helix domain-containing protein [Kineococcus indalonis]NAZ85519.1 transcriptional regulator [Kineococcus indalonis]
MTEAVKRGSRLSGAERSQLAEELSKGYAEGKSIRALAEEAGRSYGFVHRLLSESEVSLRSRGGATRGRAKQRHEADTEQHAG